VTGEVIRPTTYCYEQKPKFHDFVLGLTPSKPSLNILDVDCH